MFIAPGIIVFLIFGRLTFLEQPQLRLAFASRKWRPVTGVVIDIEDIPFMVDPASRYASGSRENLITVHYEVSGVRFKTQNYSFGGHLDQPYGIHRMDQKLTVYYNPSNPAEAVVKRGVTFSLFVSPLLCLAGLVLVIGMALQKD